jgi:methyl-coenzyme M reductase alpha subunit
MQLNTQKLSTWVLIYLSEGLEGKTKPGGIAFGYLADICQSSRVNWEDPVRVTLDVVASGAMLYDQIWLDLTCLVVLDYTNTLPLLTPTTSLTTSPTMVKNTSKTNMVESRKHQTPWTPYWNVASEVTFYGLEQYEEFPALLEDQFGGSQRAAVVAAASGCSTGFATGNAQTALSGWYLSMYLTKNSTADLVSMVTTCRTSVEHPTYSQLEETKDYHWN